MYQFASTKSVEKKLQHVQVVRNVQQKWVGASLCVLYELGKHLLEYFFFPRWQSINGNNNNNLEHRLSQIRPDFFSILFFFRIPWNRSFCHANNKFHGAHTLFRAYLLTFSFIRPSSHDIAPPIDENDGRARFS